MCPNWISDAARSACRSNGKAQLEQLLPFVPVDLVPQVQHRLGRIQAHRLHDPGLAERPGDLQTLRHRDDRVQVDQVGPVPAVLLVDVPGVPLGRGVSVQLQQVSRRPLGDQFPVGAPVDQRADQAPPIDLDPYGFVLQHESVPARLRLDRRLGTDHQRAERRHAALGERPGVGQDLLLTGTGQGAEGRLDDGGQRLGHRRVIALGLGMDPGDRRPGQDVVELLQQHGLPSGGQLGRRVGGAAAYGGGGRPQLGLPEQVLAAPVALLGPRLGGVRPAMELQVQLARPDRRVGHLCLGIGEEGARRC